MRRLLLLVALVIGCGCLPEADSVAKVQTDVERLESRVGTMEVKTGFIESNVGDVRAEVGEVATEVVGVKARVEHLQVGGQNDNLTTWIAASSGPICFLAYVFGWRPVRHWRQKNKGR